MILKSIVDILVLLTVQGQATAREALLRVPVVGTRILRLIIFLSPIFKVSLPDVA